MTEHDLFPDDPSRRRALLLVSPHERSAIFHSPKDAPILGDDEVTVLTLPLAPEIAGHRALRRISSANLARPRTLLVQSPYDVDVYANAEHASTDFAVAKYLRISQLCQVLGARRVSVVQLERSSSKVSGNFEAVLKVDIRGSGQVTVEKKEDEELWSKLSLDDEFPGGPPNIEAAEELLERSNLMGDANLLALVEQRRFEQNPLKERKLVVDLTSETKLALSVAGRVRLSLLGELSSKLKTTSEKHTQYRLTLSVGF